MLYYRQNNVKTIKLYTCMEQVWRNDIKCFSTIYLVNYCWFTQPTEFLCQSLWVASSVAKVETQCKNKEHSSCSWKSGHSFILLTNSVNKAALKTRKQNRKQHLLEGVWKRSMSFKKILINSLIWISLLVGYR